MNPTDGLKPGRIVYFVFDEQSIAEVRAYCLKTGSTCNPIQIGDRYPAMVVRVWQGTSVNLKVMLDGTDTYWATSVEFDAGTPAVTRGTTQYTEYKLRTWHWMFEGQQTRYQPDRVEKLA